MRRPSPVGGIAVVCPRCTSALASAEGGARCETCGAGYRESEGILHLVMGGVGAPGYDPHYFKTLPFVEERHFWFVGRREVVLDALRRAVPDLERRALFDIGCGSGGLLRFLAGARVPVSGACDAYLEGLRIARRRVQVPLLLVDEGRRPPLAAGQSLIGLFDVLEHIDDDRETLCWIWSVLEPGGVLVLTVPAHPFLFDEMDELAQHRRRYRRRELGEKLRSAGFEVRLLQHFMVTLVPMLVALRRLGRLLPLRSSSAHARRNAELRIVPGLNGLMLGLLRLERSLGRLVPLPFGSSLVAVAARPAERTARP